VHSILLTHWHPTTSATWQSCVAGLAPESWPTRSMHRLSPARSPARDKGPRCASWRPSCLRRSRFRLTRG
jgi:hypothetical protein